MKRSLSSLLVLPLLLIASAAPIPAFPPPQNYHLTTVSWVIGVRNDLDQDDRYVTLVGHVTARIGDEEYWFTDGTGSVRLDSAHFRLPIGPLVSIGGRVDQAYLGFGHLEVDVRRWHYARQAPPQPYYH